MVSPAKFWTFSEVAAKLTIQRLQRMFDHTHSQLKVLINQAKGDLDASSANCTLSMLDTTDKLLENLIKPRLADAVRAAGNLPT